MSYDAVQALIKALTLNPNPTRANIQQTLKASDFSAPGAGGIIEFLPSGDRKTQVQLLEIQKVDKSRSHTGYDFVPISNYNNSIF